MEIRASAPFRIHFASAPSLLRFRPLRFISPQSPHSSVSLPVHSDFITPRSPAPFFFRSTLPTLNFVSTLSSPVFSVVHFFNYSLLSAPCAPSFISSSPSRVHCSFAPSAIVRNSPDPTPPSSRPWCLLRRHVRPAQEAKCARRKGKSPFASHTSASCLSPPRASSPDVPSTIANHTLAHSYAFPSAFPLQFGRLFLKPHAP